jgi:hypothetical protein
MAKARDIAALAGLAGLAYAMRKKGDKDDAGDQKTSSYTGNTKKVEAKVEAKDEPLRKIEDYQKKAPGDEKGSAQSDVLKAITAPKAASNDKAPSQGVLPPKSLTPAVEPKVKSSVGSGTRPTSAKNPNYSNEGRGSTAPTAKNPDYSNEGRSSTATTSTTKPQFEMPISKFFKSIRAAGEKDLAARGMKNGGKATKMASGGMTSSASKRADGIATKGKTRGRIC